MAFNQNIRLGRGAFLAGMIGLIGLSGMIGHQAAVAAEPGRDEIIWDDSQSQPPSTPERPPQSAVPPDDSFHSAPIRDNFPHPAAKAADSVPRKSDITWDEPGIRTPAAASRPDNSAAGPCREFQQRVMIDGRPQQVHGRACRQSDGAWRIVN
jgi:hypothetical protein